MQNYCFKDQNQVQFPFSIIHTLQNGFFPQHRHSYTELGIILNGRGINITNDRKCQMCRGSVYTIPPPVTHQMEDMENMESYILKFDLEHLIALDYELKNDPIFRALFIFFSPAGSQADIRPLQLSEQQLQHVVSLSQVMIREYQDQHPGYGVMIRSHLLALTTYLARCFHPDSSTASAKQAQMIRSVIYMEDHLAQPVRIPELAEMSFLSARQYDRVFKELYGISPSQYLLELRLNRACQMMADPAIALSEIWQACGFTDNPFFYRRFKQKYGVTPGEYRATLQNSLYTGSSEKY